MRDVWPCVRDERLALIADLVQLTDEQWATPSLCAGWTIHDVVAHVVDTAKTSIASFGWGMVRARFDFDRQNQTGVERERRATPHDTLAELRSVVDLRRSPPAPRDSRLVEAIVHGEDIRRPLGIGRSYRADAVVDAFRLQAKTSAGLGGAKTLLDGLAVSATDVDLSHGIGDPVQGPALELLLAACGRSGALDGLKGPGAAILRKRLQAD